MLAASALLRDRIALGVGMPPAELMNPDVQPGDALSVPRAASGLAAIEAARAELAEDFNLNVRLVLGTSVPDAGRHRRLTGRQRTLSR